MAYEVTATRRRPKTLTDLVGQEFVVATLKNSIENGRIANAYLFTGPRGCGKTSTARILAKALNCQDGPKAEPCGTCSTCQEITKGSCLDVIEIDGASNTGVNDVRQIKDEIMFPPNSCRYKIYIIDEVHMLSIQAFNALLKTIEEPPPYVIFIFATTELQKVPATIKSRCQQFNFRLVPIDKVKEQLSLACQEINITAEDEALYWIARESTGSMRDAYTLFDQVAAFSDGHITYDKIRDKLGLVGTEKLNDLFESCVAGKVQDTIDKIDSFIQTGISIEQLILNSSDYLRSVLLIKSGVTKESLLGQTKERYSTKLLDSWQSIQIERALSIFLNLYRDIRYSLSPRYELELAFSKLCWLKDYVSPQELKSSIDNAQALLMQGVKVAGSQQASNFTSTQQPSWQPPSFTSGQTNNSQGFTNTAFGNSNTANFANSTNQTNATSTANSGFGNSTSTSQFTSGQSMSSSQNFASAPTSTGFGSQPTSVGFASSTPATTSSNFANSTSTSIGFATSNPTSTSANFGNATPTSTSTGFTNSATPSNTGATNPFYNGGALPPDNTAATTNDLESVRAKIISYYSINDAFIGASLNQSENWTLENNCVKAYTISTFQKDQLNAKKFEISKQISAIIGSQIAFEAVYKEQKQTVVMQDIPEKVKIVERIFKGKILGA